jgi:hypothetical protein
MVVRRRGETVLVCEFFLGGELRTVRVSQDQVELVTDDSPDDFGDEPNGQRAS